MFRAKFCSRVGGLTNRIIWIFLLSFYSVSASAGFGGASLGVSYPTPLGNAYSTLNPRYGVQGEIWLNPSFLPPILQFHFSSFYDSFYLRNQPSINMPTFGFFGGMQLQSPEYGSTVSSFLVLDIGGVYNSLSFSSGSSGVTNSNFAFATQVVPGLDVPIYKSFGIQAEAPIRVIFTRSPWVILDAVFALRLKL